jgi:hypothetical protein
MLPTNTVVDHHLGQSQGLDQDIPIDPALFDIEQIVYDARKNKERLMGEEETRRAVDHLPVQMAEAEEEVMNDHGDDNGAGDGLGLLDEEFDPALREIVNSLTNAQQVWHHVSREGDHWLIIVDKYNGDKSHSGSSTSSNRRSFE